MRKGATIAALLMATSPAAALISEDDVFEKLSGSDQVALENAFRYSLLDSASARIQVVPKGNGNFCGMINAKNSFGAYTGFKPFALSREPLFFFYLPKTEVKDEAERSELISKLIRAQLICSSEFR